MKNQECSSSNTVCIEHFTPEDYSVSSNGKTISLNAGAVPTIFNVILLEVDDDYDDDSEIINDVETVPNIPSCCTKTREENEQLKCKLRSDYINYMKANSQIERVNKIKQQQARDIQSLKKQVAYLRKKLDQKQKKIDELYYIDLKVIFSFLKLCHRNN